MSADKKPRKHRHKRHYTFMIISGDSDGSTKRLHLNHFKTQVLAYCSFAIVLALVCYIIYSAMAINTLRSIQAEQKKQIEDLKVENSTLEASNETLVTEEQQLRAALNLRLENEQQSAEEAETLAVPTGFPLTAGASAPIAAVDDTNSTTVTKITDENKDTKIHELELKEENGETQNTEELVVKDDDKEVLNEIIDIKKEINYDISNKLLQLFLKIFSYLSIFIISYYILIGTEMMGLIYGKKWQTNNIDKIGDCYSFYVILMAVSDLIISLGNATNDTHQMNLSYISLIINAIFLTFFSFAISKWDICGLIIANVLSDVFLINYNFYIILR